MMKSVVLLVGIIASSLGTPGPFGGPMGFGRMPISPGYPGFGRVPYSSGYSALFGRVPYSPGYSALLGRAPFSLAYTRFGRLPFSSGYSSYLLSPYRSPGYVSSVSARYSPITTAILPTVYMAGAPSFGYYYLSPGEAIYAPYSPLASLSPGMPPAFSVGGTGAGRLGVSTTGTSTAHSGFGVGTFPAGRLGGLASIDGRLSGVTGFRSDSGIYAPGLAAGNAGIGNIGTIGRSASLIGVGHRSAGMINTSPRGGTAADFSLSGGSMGIGGVGGNSDMLSGGTYSLSRNDLRYPSSGGTVADYNSVNGASLGFADGRNGMLSSGTYSVAGSGLSFPSVGGAMTGNSVNRGIMGFADGRNGMLSSGTYSVAGSGLGFPSVGGAMPGNSVNRGIMGFAEGRNDMLAGGTYRAAGDSVGFPSSGGTITGYSLNEGPIGVGMNRADRIYVAGSENVRAGGRNDMFTSGSYSVSGNGVMRDTSFMNGETVGLGSGGRRDIVVGPGPELYPADGPITGGTEMGGRQEFLAGPESVPAGPMAFVADISGGSAITGSGASIGEGGLGSGINTNAKMVLDVSVGQGSGTVSDFVGNQVQDAGSVDAGIYSGKYFRNSGPLQDFPGAGTSGTDLVIVNGGPPGKSLLTSDLFPAASGDIPPAGSP